MQQFRWYMYLQQGSSHTLPGLPVVLVLSHALHTCETGSEHVTTGHFLDNSGLESPDQPWLQHQRTTPRPPRPPALGHTELCCCQGTRHQLRGQTHKK